MPLAPLSLPLTDNELYPGYRDDFNARVSHDLARLDQDRSKARAAGRHAKKFPKARDYYWPTEADTGPGEGEGYYFVVRQHLLRYALHLLYVREKGQDERLDLVDLDRRTRRDWLISALVDHVWAEGRGYLYFSDREAGNGFQVDWYAVPATAADVTDIALDAYKPIKDKLREWGSKGGKASRRGRAKTLDGLEGLSIAEQAERLGVTPRTVSRMRADAKQTIREVKVNQPADGDVRSVDTPAPALSTERDHPSITLGVDQDSKPQIENYLTSTEAHFNYDREPLTDKPQALTDKPSPLTDKPDTMPTLEEWEELMRMVP